jgi:DNA-binding NtrC family response regulator
MTESLLALLVHGQSELFGSLKHSLKELSVETCSVATCREAQDLIYRRRPNIVFTESSLRDGWWSNILNMAESADVPLNVIVVSPYPDTRLYLSVMERGAFDFVVPPFELEPLGCVVRLAALKTIRCSKPGLVHAAVA